MEQQIFYATVRLFCQPSLLGDDAAHFSEAALYQRLYTGIISECQSFTGGQECGLLAFGEDRVGDGRRKSAL
jgi:hypothetical protein